MSDPQSTGDEAELAQFGYSKSEARHTGRFASFANGRFDLGAWDKPVLVVAVVWLVFELAPFRDASFEDAWLHVIVTVVIGAAYLGYLLAMPDQHSIDAVLDQEAGTARP